MPSENFPKELYSKQQSQLLDKEAMSAVGMAGNILMGRAGHAAFDVMLECFPSVREIAVVCGTGNNGGDAFVCARLAKLTGRRIRLFQVGDAAKINGDALLARSAWHDCGGESEAYHVGCLQTYKVVIDGLLGTGIKGAPKQLYCDVIRAINEVPGIIALDVPSGLDPDTGIPLGEIAVNATATISFITLKQGLMTGLGRDYSGKIFVDDLQVPGSVFKKFSATASCLQWPELRKILTPRKNNCHKGDYGHVLVVGGNSGRGGAVMLAAQGALRTGAGLVSIATQPEYSHVFTASCPEIMCYGISEIQDLQVLKDTVDVVAIGPGLGRDAWGQSLFQEIITWKQPMIVDADALNLLAISKEGYKKENWVLTPHPGEAARLLCKSTQEVQGDRFAAVAKLQAKYQGVVVLKGAGTLICDAYKALWVCLDGNPGMATAGMGDVLTGIISSLLAQGLSTKDAARVGVCLHARAADLCVNDHSERGLMASDLFAEIRKVM